MSLSLPVKGSTLPVVSVVGDSTVSTSNVKSVGAVGDAKVPSADVTAGMASEMFRNFGDMGEWSNPVKAQNNVWKNFWSEDSSSAGDGKHDAVGWNKIRNGTDGIFNWTIHSNRRLTVRDANGFVDLGNKYLEEDREIKANKEIAKLIEERDVLLEENRKLKLKCGIIMPQPIISISPGLLN